MPAPRKVAQPLELQYDQIVDALDCPIPAVKPSRKGIPCPHKGVPILAKWEFTEEEVQALLKVLKNLRDRIMLRLGIYLGLRISELLSLTVDDCTEADGRIKDVIIIPSIRLKGGRDAPPKVYVRPEGHEEGKCHCRPCELVEGKIQPKPRRKPDDMKKYLSPSAQKLVHMLLDRLATTRGGLADRSRFLFESRKTRWKKTQPKRNRPISRQAAWDIVKTAARRAQLQYIGRVGTHSFRKSFAMNTLEVTGDMRKVMAGLGHRAQNTTESYVRNDSRQMFEALRDASIKNSEYLEIGLVA